MLSAPPTHFAKANAEALFGELHAAPLPASPPPTMWMSKDILPAICEQQSDEAIELRDLDCFTAVAMTERLHADLHHWI